MKKCRLKLIDKNIWGEEIKQKYQDLHADTVKFCRKIIETQVKNEKSFVLNVSILLLQYHQNLKDTYITITIHSLRSESKTANIQKNICTVYWNIIQMKMKNSSAKHRGKRLL